MSIIWGPGVERSPLMAACGVPERNPVCVQAVPGQTGDILRLLDANGNILSSWDVNGNTRTSGLAAQAKRVNTNYQATASDFWIGVDCSTHPPSVRITLPPISALPGQKIHITKTDASTNFVAIIPAGSDTIFGFSEFDLATQFQDAWLENDGVSQWYVSNWVLNAAGVSMQPVGSGIFLQVLPQAAGDAGLHVEANGTANLIQGAQDLGNHGIVWQVTAAGDVLFTDASTTTFARPQGAVRHAWVSNVDATRTGRLRFTAYDFNAEREGIRIEGDGSAARIGFLGAPAVVQQANASQAAINAVTDANAKSALQAIYNLLKNYGLAPATA